MELDARRVVRADAAHAHEDYIGAHLGELGDEAVGIHPSVHLAQVGLHPADGLGGPPARLSEQEVGCKQQNGQTSFHVQHLPAISGWLLPTVAQRSRLGFNRMGSAISAGVTLGPSALASPNDTIKALALPAGTDSTRPRNPE